MYIDASHIQHASYDDACRYYGADTRADCDAEARYQHEEDLATYHGEAMIEAARAAGHVAPFDPVADWSPYDFDAAEYEATASSRREFPAFD